MDYPKERYHKAGGSVTVLNKEHEKLFPYPDWQDNPFEVAVEEKPKRKKREEAIEVA